ncbi:MAG: HyaD/HybD family hydrogenase maturation endopeptidase [Candidatus Omnitrophica bacterium]|nr:HyaD/HybD family hydrogenase maturation endopeptidase [Candidatus Omnitrophota bacterium]
MYKKVVILGLGNILLKDEGIGVHISEELTKLRLGDNIEIIDGGTASLDALIQTANFDKLVIVDALRAGKKPGTIYRFNSHQLHAHLDSRKLSLHQFSLLEALSITEKTGNLPKEVIFIGVEPEKIDWGLEVSKSVKEKIPEIIKLVTQELPN